MARYVVKYEKYFISFVALSLTLACASLLRLENNAYTGIVVAIGPDVPETNAEHLIQRIKELFRNASPVLHTATGGLASFGRVTILVPATWSSHVVTDGLATYESFSKSHIRVDGPAPQHGHAPYTRQPGRCSEPGHYVHFTPQYLLNQSGYGSPAKVLVHEWAHFRYGVFDEYGFQDDPIYPHVYWDDEAKQPKPTGCNDTEVYGHHNLLSEECQVDPSTGQYSSHCKFIPDQTQTDVTSSLMYLNYLPKVDKFCDDETHNSKAPNKHNAMCDGQSIGSIVKKHTDFKNVEPSAVPENPTFRVLRAQKDKLFVLLDISRGMQNNEREQFLRTALNLFFSALLPDDIGVGIGSFSDKPKHYQQVVPLSPEWRNAIKNFIPPVTTDYATWETIVDAITKAKQELISGGTLLLVTAGNTNKPTTSSFFTLCSQLQSAGIRVAVLLYSNANQPSAISLSMSELAEKTNGVSFYVYEQTPGGYSTYPVVLTQLVSALASVAGNLDVERDQEAVVVKETTHSERSIKSSFFIDETIGRKVIVTFVSQNKNAIDLSGLRLMGPDGTVYNYLNWSSGIFSSYDTTFQFKIDNAKVGEWKYEVKLNVKHPITVIVTSLRNIQKPVTVRGWTSAGNTKVNASATRVVLYAEVMQGNNPVINARVFARVQRPRPDDGEVSIQKIQLFDNGNGDPDTTKNDGVYSRYFTNFTYKAENYYLVTIYVDDGNGSSQIVMSNTISSGVLPMNPNTPYCCGSEANATETKPTGRFSRSANAGTFLVMQPPQQGDYLAPSKISNLRILEFNRESMKVVLQWTAPGDDLDQGNASFYEVKYSPSRDMLEKQFDMASFLANIPLPEAAGTIQRMEIFQEMKFDPITHHYAIRAIDMAGNKGPVSNVVTVQYPALPPLPTSLPPMPSNDSSSTPVPNGKMPRFSTGMIGLIVGCILGVFLLLTILIIVIIVHARRRKAREADHSRSIPSPKQPPNVFISSPVPVNDKESKKPQVGNGNAKPPHSANTPQFMSASELLERHELQKAQQRSATPSYQDDIDHRQQQQMLNYHPATVLPSDKYIIPYTPYEQQYPSSGLYVAAPYRDTGSLDRGSFSDKHSSSFTSGSTGELRKDNGYFTSYEETSEDSAIVRSPMAPGALPIGPMVSSKTSLVRKTVSESQV